MKIPNTLKQSGGADIKLKIKKLPGIVKVFLLVLFSFLFLYVLYYITDNLFNGSFRQWLSDRYTSANMTTDIYTGEMISSISVDWFQLKTDVLIGGALLICFFVLAVHFSVQAGRRRQEQETVSEISEGIHTYLEKDVELEEAFPPSCMEIGIQVVQMKNSMEKKEQQLKAESQRKNDLITYLAHDLKTPLTSVMGYLSLLEEAPDMPQQQRQKYTRIALEKADRLESLMNEFFEITQYNLQNMILEKEEIDLYYMLVQMAEEFYPVLEAKGNTCEIHAEENVKVYGDPERLARVFNNILKNAVAYSYPKTAVKICAQQQDSGVQIQFINRGKTIPNEKLKFLFEKFFRLDEARRTNTGGAGLGLAIAKEIVELHGGTITAESGEEQTVFTVELPNRKKF